MDFLRSLKPASKAQRPSSQSSRNSKRYRASTHLIPTPGIEAHRPRKYNTWPLVPWKIFGLASLMIVIGIATEIALAISNKNDGFPLAQKNIFAFAHVQTSFLTSFFPTIFIFPLSFLWELADYTLRWYQPYVVLSRGNARAEDSLLLDYVWGNRILTMFRTLRKREWIIYFSLGTAMATSLYQPLAGALLSVKQVPKTKETEVQGTTTLGLIPDFTSLNAFLAAAGFTEAAAFQSLPDPPFVKDGWATAQFAAPDNAGINPTIAVTTTGIRTSANCASPNASPPVDTSNSNNYSISATLPDGCSSEAFFDPRSADQQYGTAPANPASCGLPSGTGQQFAPVMFWFAHNNTQGTFQADAVICRPTLELFNIVANVNLNNFSLSDVTILNEYTTSNNVSGDPLNGQVFNAVLFGDIPDGNAFVQARATAIASQIPGAIFRFASQNATALAQYFSRPDGFLNLTSQIYTQHLSVSAKTVYFVPSNQALSAQLTSLVERLIVDKLAGHALAVLLIFIGMVGIAVHLAHRHVRRKLWLTTHPGTIASVVALTSHSGFGDNLYPFDDKRTLQKKLENMRFSLDRRTGAIIADELEDDGDSGMSMRTRYQDDESDVEKMELRRMESRAPLLDGEGKSGSSQLTPPQAASVLDLPYEHEPLVLQPSRSPSRSPDPSRGPPRI